ncbi:MAG: hypothetical protein JO244_11825 [Solirubrobacterales bacterium]|nr:hypothetical protein [Solirubrobacterales bacterium]
MLEAAAAGVSQPVVAALLGLGASGLAGAVVAMAWNVNARQIRLAEQLVRRQYIVTGDTREPEHALNGHAGPEAAQAEVQEALVGQGVMEVQGSKEAHGAQGGQLPPGTRRAAGARTAKLVIDGPENVVVGEQVRYRLRPSAEGKAVTWAAGGGAVSQSPDPAHPDELLLIADRPGSLMLHVRVREGLTERRETKSVTAVPDVAPAASPFPLRLFLHGWGLTVIAILIIGFAGALVALGNLTSADFIALVVPLAALLGVLAVARGKPGPEP